MADLRNRLNKRKLLDSEDAPSGRKSAQATPGLLTELRQWHFARSLVDVFMEYADGQTYFSRDKQRSEALNMLDRWLLSFQLDYSKSMDSRYPLFPQSLCPDDPVNQKLMDECLEKKFSTGERNARQIFDELDSRLREFLSEKHSDDEKEAAKTRVELIDDDQTGEAHVQMRDFKSKHCWRVMFLVRNFGLLAAARMLMRYEALGTGSLQWGDPITVHNALHDLMGVRYEGFASPLNSKMIDKEDSRFCSLFIDTDRVFGSMGSFFKVDFDTCEGGWTVNPPFIEELMDRVAKKILDHLDKGGRKNWYFVTFPRWTDTPAWTRLSKTHHLIDKIELDDGGFAVQDSYGRIFPPRNNLTIFFLGYEPNLAHQVSNLKVIKAKFRNMDLEGVETEWIKTCSTKLEAERRARLAPPGSAEATAAAAAAAGYAPASAPPPAPSNPLPAVPIVLPPPTLPRNRQIKIAKRRQNNPTPVTSAVTPAAEFSEVTPAESCGVTLAESSGVTPAKSSGVTLVESCGVTPVESCGVTPVESSGVTPAKSSGVTPAESSGVTPAEFSGVTPTESSGVTPAKFIGVTPAESSGVTPAESSGVNLPDD